MGRVNYYYLAEFCLYFAVDMAAEVEDLIFKGCKEEEGSMQEILFFQEVGVAAVGVINGFYVDGVKFLVI